MKRLEKVLKTARNGLMALGLSGALMFGSGCTDDPNPKPTPDTIIVDTAHTGMITGQVFSSKIEDNKIAYEPYKQPSQDFSPGAYVLILDTEFETETTPDGMYSIDNIPAGTYVVKALISRFAFSGYPAATQSVTVIKQQTVTVPDLKMLVEPVLKGKIYNEKEKITPFCGKEVTLYKAGGYPLLIDSTITSSDGSYAFERCNKEGCANKFYLKNKDSIIMFSDTDSEFSEYIPSGYDIREEHAYATPK